MRVDGLTLRQKAADICRMRMLSSFKLAYSSAKMSAACICPCDKLLLFSNSACNHSMALSG